MKNVSLLPQVLRCGIISINRYVCVAGSEEI